jgi:SOS-response transcriptional repressor LexA
MRLYREEILVSLDAYSPTEFFDPGDLAGSFSRYAKLKDPHPLAGHAQGKLVACLEHPRVAKVLDPASHHMTESDVTQPMAEDCLLEMRRCEGQVRNELDRLDKLRVRSLRDATIAASIVPFPTLSDQVVWPDPINVPVIGLAAAKSTGWSVEFQDDQLAMQFPSGAAVAASSQALEPVARFGQWILLADEMTIPHDGDIVAARDSDGNCYLRRVWSDSREWVLQSVNPVQELPVVVSPKRATGIRKVIGVLYEPLASVAQRPTGVHEWSPCTSFNPAWLTKYRAIEVKGSSLDPIARDGQRVLVDHQAAAITDVEDGALVVVETDEEGIGNLIKRVFRQGKTCVFVSPNPVDAIAPVTLSLKAVRAVWPLRGVLFSTL